MRHPHHQHERRSTTIAAALVCLAVSACSTMATSEFQSVYDYNVPGRDFVTLPLDDVFQCMKDTGALEGQGFAVGPFSNETGKRNEVAAGGTGSFLPTGPNVSIYAMEAVARAGGTVFDYSSLDLVRNIAFVGGEGAARHLHGLQNQNMPNFGIKVFATALDFSGGSQADVRIDGVGPIFDQATARAYYAAHIIQPGSQRSLARGYAVYEAEYRSIGLGLSRFFGGGSGTLVTGSLAFARQEPLQRPVAEGVMVAVAYAMLEIPALADCKDRMLPFEAIEAQNILKSQEK